MPAPRSPRACGPSARGPAHKTPTTHRCHVSERCSDPIRRLACGNDTRMSTLGERTVFRCGTSVQRTYVERTVEEQHKQACRVVGRLVQHRLASSEVRIGAWADDLSICHEA